MLKIGALRNAIAAGLLVGPVLTPVVVVAPSALAAPGRPASPGTGPSSEAKTKAAGAHAALPLRFEPNQGQTDEAVRFVARTNAGTLFLTPKEAVLRLAPPPPPPKGLPDAKGADDSERPEARPELPVGPRATPERDEVVRMRAVGADPGVTLEATDRLAGVSNYLIGRDRTKWKTNVAGFAAARYRDIYPGIDLVFHGRQAALEYDFVVSPGADASVIALAFEGPSDIGIDAATGDLVMKSSLGELRQAKPVVYQEVGGTRRSVKGEFVLGVDDKVGFEVGAYDRSLPLVIDPIIEYSTFLGGSGDGVSYSGDDYAEGIDVDSSGSAYIAGGTASIDFPTRNGRQPTNPSQYRNSAFVTKLTPDGSAIVYSTYLGGTDYDQAVDIVVDSAGSPYITGYAASSDFPTTANAFAPTCTLYESGVCSGDGFVTKLSPDGSALAYSTYLGGTDGFDYARGIAIDTQANAYVAVMTQSLDFPTTATAFDRTCGLDGSCGANQTFTGGSSTAGSPTYTFASRLFNGQFRGKAITGDNIPPGTTIAAVVDETTITLSQNATGTGSGLSFTVLGFNNPAPDAVLAKIATTASGPDSLRYASYAGGDSYDTGFDVAAHPAVPGIAYMVGGSGGNGFPTSPDAFQPDCGRQFCSVAYVAKFDTRVAGDQSLTTGPDSYVTFLGGSGSNASGNGVDVDPTGSAYVVGHTESADYPVTANAFQRTMPGGGDGFVAKLLPDGSGLAYSTFLGGSAGYDYPQGVDIDGGGAAHVTGFTSSEDFPVKDPVQGFPGSFVTKLAASGSALDYSTFLDAALYGVSASPDGNATYVSGSALVADFPGLPGSFRAGPGGGSDAVVIKLVTGRPPVVTALSAKGGPTSGGTPVVITGEGFAGASSVRFGAIPASSFTVDSDTRITAISPPHPEGTIAELTVPVTVTTPAATSLNVGATRFLYGEGIFAPTGSCVGSCPMFGPAVTMANGKVLYMNGDGYEEQAQSQVFDPLTGTWAMTGACDGCGFTRVGPSSHLSITALPGGPAELCGANCGKVLVAGGTVLSDTSEPSATPGSFLFDPATGTWTATATPMNVARSGHSATLLPSGKVVVAGGCTADFGCDYGGEMTDTSEIFDPLTGSWTLTQARMANARVGHSATLLDPAVGGCGANCGMVLVAFGAEPVEGRALETAELFDPATGAWASTAGSPDDVGRMSHAAVQLLDGRVLAFGGVDTAQYGSQPQASTEVFDPVAGTWEDKAQLTFPRAFDPAAVRLASGKVLVAGHFGPCCGVSQAAAEIWDPADERWHSATRTVGTPVDGPVAALLPPGPASVCGTNCGKVLVAGGLVDQGAVKGEAASELYTPRPDVAGFDVTSGPAEGGTTVTLRGTGLASATSVRFGGTPASFTPDSTTPDTRMVAVSPSHPAGSVPVTVASPGGISTGDDFTFTAAAAPPTTAPPGTEPAGGTGTGPAPGTEPAGGTGTGLGGYRLVGADGGIFAFGPAPFFGSTGAIRLNQPIVGTATTPSGRGYWLVAADGGIFAFGDARFLGSTGAIKLNQPVVGMAPTPSGNGYWLVAADGGIFAFGDARFLGSTGAIKLNQPIVGLAATPTGDGYRLVARDGGIFAFGDATFLGSTGAIKLAQPVVGLASTASGKGYRMVAADGGIFAFGDATFLGSTGAIKLAQPVVGLAFTGSGNGYWLVARDGGIFAFGDAEFFGSTGAIKLNQPVVGMASG